MVDFKEEKSKAANPVFILLQKLFTKRQRIDKNCSRKWIRAVPADWSSMLDLFKMFYLFCRIHFLGTNNHRQSDWVAEVLKEGMKHIRKATKKTPRKYTNSFTINLPALRHFSNLLTAATSTT
jgi:hypothetical protein